MPGDEILLPTSFDDLPCPRFCGLNCMPVLILSYQSERLRHLHTTVSFHSMQNWNCLLCCRWIWVFSDVYKLQCSLACIAWFTRANHEAIDMGISILYYISNLALFTLDFVLLLRVMCVIPSYIWIYITIIYYLFSLEFQRVFDL